MIPQVRNTIRKVIFLSVLPVLLQACSEGAETPVPQPEGPAIRWSVCSDEAQVTRALVSDDVLRTSCTPDAHGNSESIGVWGQYAIDEGGQTNVYPEFVATPLTYAPKQVDSNPYNEWNYPGEARMWQIGGRYDFRACYPQALMSSLMTQMDATIIQGGPVNTSVIQTDLLVAAAHVDTRTDVLSGPVPLNMQHVFSALRFKVRAEEGYTPPSGDGVTSCWLQNIGEGTNQFSPSGYLVHSGNKEPEITWYTYESVSTPMYKWENNGVSFKTEGILYTSNGTQTGKEYTGNEGWLLVVPQTIASGTLQVCYTLKSSPGQVFRVNIPAITYVHGMRYTYVLVISGAGVELKLSIAKWNQLDSVYDIVL